MNDIIAETIEKYRRDYSGKLIFDNLRKDFLLIVDAELDLIFQSVGFKVISKNRFEFLSHGLTTRYSLVPEVEVEEEK